MELLAAEFRAKIGEDVVRAANDSANKQRVEATGQMVASVGDAVFKKPIEGHLEALPRTAEFIGLTAGRVGP